MIIIPSGKGLQRALSLTYFPTSDKSVRDVLCYVKIEQIETEKTAITAFGEGGAWFQRYIQGSGVTGTTFLFRPNRIEDDESVATLLGKREYNESLVAIYQDESELAFSSVQEMNGMEIKREGACNHFPMYDGEVDEETETFGPPQFAQTLLGEVNAEVFNNMVRDAHNFGGDNYRNYSVCYFVLSPNRLQILASNYRRVAQLCRSARADTDSEAVMAFNAVYLRYLVDLGADAGTVKICRDEGEEENDMVTFESDGGRVTLPVYEDRRIYDLVDHQLAVINEERHGEVEEQVGNPLEYVGKRVVRLKESYGRVEVQKTRDLQLRLDSKGSNLEVKKLKDTQRKRPDASQLPIVPDYEDCLDTEWVPLAINYDFFLRSLGVAVSFINRQEELPTDAIALNLYRIWFEQGELYKYFLLMEPLSSPPTERYQLLYMPNPISE